VHFALALGQSFIIIPGDGSLTVKTCRRKMFTLFDGKLRNVKWLKCKIYAQHSFYVTFFQFLFVISK